MRARFDLSTGLPLSLSANDSDGLFGLKECVHLLQRECAEGGTVTEGWVRNAVRMIAWKLAAQERFFAPKFDGRMLTLANLIKQARCRLIWYPAVLSWHPFPAPARRPYSPAAMAAQVSLVSSSRTAHARAHTDGARV